MLCKPGYYYVKKHIRISKNGIRHIVEAYCRKNSNSKKDFLYSSNLNYLFEKFRNKYKYKKLKKIRGYRDDGQYDVMIQFWLKYWKGKDLIKFDIDPLLIKAMIAAESSFRERVITKLPGSTATGLMQITTTTMRILAGKYGKEIRKCRIEITQQEARSANSNIAAGVRWIIYKITTSPGKRAKTLKEKIYAGVKYYHSWDKEGEEYARKVWKIYELSNKN
ncbi:MAG: transglycosylase SLT domain-containing protein [Bacteriovoracaceae bacterium]|nr:transglycosylase SLT domain-containing protein [Bacteriovoracaceae bacterium]